MSGKTKKTLTGARENSVGSEAEGRRTRKSKVVNRRRREVFLWWSATRPKLCDRRYGITTFSNSAPISLSRDFLRPLN